jgi:4-amino-4-deoxy-L-arabinose transferase-like glycosyltransferase
MATLAGPRPLTHRRIGLSNMARFRAVAAVAVVLVAALALFAARVVAYWHAAVTSDESLYLSEAVAIAHGHLAYSSGAPIVHRPPLFPATLAPLLMLTHNNVDAARIVPALYALAALAALFILGRVLFGSMAAAAGVVLAAAAAYPARMSASFFVDTPSTAFLLASAAALMYGLRAGRAHVWWCAFAGGLLGVAFLLKETAIFWAPLPLLLAPFDTDVRARLGMRGLAAWCGAFALFAGPWFAWVAWQTGSVYKLSERTLAELAVAALAVAALALVLRRGWRAGGRQWPFALAGALLAGWCAISLRVLELRPEPQAIDYQHTVPHWLAHVFGTSVEPSPVIALAWVFVLYRAVRGDAGARALALIASLSMPLLVFVANRGWEPREVMPLVYLSYLALAWAAMDAGANVAARWRQRDRYLAAVALVTALVLIAGFVSGWNSGSPGGTNDAAILDWTGPQEHETSALLNSLPAGSVVISSRLYYSQLYVDHDARLTVRQLPTLGVQFAPGDENVQAFGSLLRYDDPSVDVHAPRHWIYLREHAERDYAIGLAEEDLLGSIGESHAGYILLSGDDAGFSALSYLPYFQSNPAFRLVGSTGAGAVRSYLFAIDRDHLQLAAGPLFLELRDIAYIDASVGDGTPGDGAFWQRIAPDGIVLNGGARIDADAAAEIVRDLRAGPSPAG